MAVPEIETPRLRLRAWCDTDLAPFARMNADPAVMEWYPSALDRAASDALATSAGAALEARGWGLWAVEVKEGGSFAGYLGLAPADLPPALEDAVEVGWRLDAAWWGRGLATEGARAVCDRAFGSLGLEELVSFTAVGNRRSRRVMEKLGMRHDTADDFDHPRLPSGHPLRRHVLYRLGAAEWAGMRAGSDRAR